MSDDKLFFIMTITLELELTMIDIIKKLQTIPAISKFMLNHYSPFKGAGIEIDHFDLKNYHIRVKMPLERKNRNVVGTHFGGSLYSMVDPFYMLILIHHLGSKYIIWDKAASINFLAPGRATVFADVRLDVTEIEQIKTLAEDYSPVYRNYTLNIFDESGLRVAEVQKTLYIRRKKPKRFF
ncbi:acyl-coenzyme A thioesterase PaaI-like protein [Acinetobacter calcoaceticus]|uniref:Acyl-coenzyme A thioesterase PaaI-like protein n=1 Tax=Acinetobacter calcoaceticus TaxID=471 RepID=A0A4R1Y5S6_ACICA|nr:acyl-coenzyme A thioesterase PaaI-like protein [Acinetobacter calcoaceticus]